MSSNRSSGAWESPASSTRLRSHEIRLEAMTDASYVMNSAVSMAQHRAMRCTTPEEEGSFADLIMGNTTPRESGIGDGGMSEDSESSEAPAQPKQELEQDPLSAAGLENRLQVLERLQNDVAGMEAIVSAVQGYYDKRSVTGRRLPKLISQAELRKRAAELTKLRHQSCISSAAATRKITTTRDTTMPQFAIFFKDGPLEDARLVISHLDKVLPAGALTSKYRVAAGTAEEAMKLYHHVLNVRADFKVVDVSLRECARIIAANCLDRAQAIDKVRQRYTEVFNVLIYVMCMEYRALTQTKRRHDKMADAWDDLERQLRVARATATMEHRIREQHAAKGEEENVRQQQVAARLQEELASAKAENSALAATLEAEVATGQQKMRAREEAMNVAHRELQLELEAVKDGSEELQRKLRVAERQLARFRKQQEPDGNLVKDVKATQTDELPPASSIPSEQPTAARPPSSSDPGSV